MYCSYTYSVYHPFVHHQLPHVIFLCLYISSIQLQSFCSTNMDSFDIYNILWDFQFTHHHLPCSPLQSLYCLYHCIDMTTIPLLRHSQKSYNESLTVHQQNDNVMHNCKLHMHVRGLVHTGLNFSSYAPQYTMVAFHMVISGFGATIAHQF